MTVSPTPPHLTRSPVGRAGGVHATRAGRAGRLPTSDESSAAGLATTSWPAYLSAVRRLVEIGRASDVDRSPPLRAARTELETVRAWLAAQHGALVAAGVPEGDLAPGPDEVDAAGRSVRAEAESVRASVRRARADVQVATALLAPGPPGFVRRHATRLTRRLIRFIGR